jgi:hypothetical protein
MADVLIFDPASEFEILENIDFEEEVQRPEQLRFFTLDEQLLDYFEKVLPKKKHISRFEYARIENDIERVKELYNKTIFYTETEYTYDLSRKKINVSWVKPIHQKFNYNAYSFKNLWNPLYQRSAMATPNYYPKMLTALPKPYKTIGEGVALTQSDIYVNDEGLNDVKALYLYNRTKTVLREDGTMSIVSLPILNTEDDIKRKGFYMQNRGVEIPNPFENHPVLSSNKPSALVTDQPLSEVFPTVEAILTHAIPTTTDPYGEGEKYLKIYDIRAKDVPWNLWKERFPPVDTINAKPTILSISIPDIDTEAAPSKTLQDLYVTKWSSGVFPRLWLMQQEDAGGMVTKMVLSGASDSGLAVPEIISEKPKPEFTASTPEECLRTENFDVFLNSGIFRNSVCVPMAFLEQERSSYISQNKVAWRETTAEDILKEHQKYLKLFQYVPVPEKSEVYETFTATVESELRREIRAILKDTERSPEDKAESIQLLIVELSVQNRIYFDHNDLFVICGHTLAILRGDLERDNTAFYSEWTAIDEGFRSCTSCGEQINTAVFSSQDDFDADGKVIISHDVLEHSTFHGESHVVSFTNSLQELKSAFILDNAGESIFYLILSLLQVLPTESQILPILANIRTLTAAVKKSKIGAEDRDRVEGIFGLAGMVVLLQTHNPFLIPRRSFGSKVLKLTGFPRDTQDDTDSPVLDMLISILRSTFESSPNTFKGPTSALFRAILRKPKDIRKETVRYLQQAFKVFQTQFISAKDRYVASPEPEILSQIYLPLIHVEKTQYTPTERLGNEELSANCNIPTPHSFLSYSLPPSVQQEPPLLWKNIRVSNSAEIIERKFDTEKLLEIDKTDISKRLKIGFPKGLEKIEKFVRETDDPTGLIVFLQRILDILSAEKFDLNVLKEFQKYMVLLDFHTDTSLLRDSVRGLINEFFKSLNAKTITFLSKYIQRDLTMNMLLMTKQEAVKQNIELRAKERDVFKQRLRQMNDTERQITKMLLDIGLAPHIITNEDREFFAHEYKYSEPETPELPDQPEDGYDVQDEENEMRLQVHNPSEADRTYGDHPERLYEEYETGGIVDDGEGYGI